MLTQKLCIFTIAGHCSIKYFSINLCKIVLPGGIQFLYHGFPNLSVHGKDWLIGSSLYG